MATYFSIGDAEFETPVLDADELLEEINIDELIIEDHESVYLSYLQTEGSNHVFHDDKRQVNLYVNTQFKDEKEEAIFHVRGTGKDAPNLLTIKMPAHRNANNVPCVFLSDNNDKRRDFVVAVISATIVQEPTICYLQDMDDDIAQALLVYPNKEVEMKFWELAIRRLFPLIVDAEKPFVPRGFKKEGFYYRNSEVQTTPKTLRDSVPSARYEHRVLTFSRYPQISGFAPRFSKDDSDELAKYYAENEDFRQSFYEFKNLCSDLGITDQNGDNFSFLLIHVLLFFYYFYDPEAV